MAKALKIWNGRGHGRYNNCNYHIYLAAYTKKQALELLNQACFPNCKPPIDIIKIGELNNYYSEGCWGNIMNGIEATEPCLYVCDEIERKPIRIL